MTAAVARLACIALVVPFAGILFFVALVTWPAVLENSVPRLSLIAYVVVCPLIPLLWRWERLPVIISVGVLTLVLQVLAVGVINFWF